MPRGVPSFSASAALEFGAATSDRLDVSNDLLAGATSLTTIQWLRPTTLTGTRRLFGFGTSASAHTKRMVLAGTGGNVAINIARAALAADYDGTGTPLATLNKFVCLALTYDESATPSCRLYVGTEQTPMATSALTENSAGVGSTNSEGTGGIYRLCNTMTASPAFAFQGSCGLAAFFFNRVLVLPELEIWRASSLDEPFPSIMGGCRGLWYPGNEGGGNALDYSGYGITGTVTGATLSRGVVLPVQDEARNRRVMRSRISHFPHLLFA